MTYTDNQLKFALAKMLPETYLWYANPQFPSQATLRVKATGYEVLDTELLHLCWLVEKGLNPDQKLDYIEILGRGEDEESFYLTIAIASDWRWRVAALAKVKGIEI